MLESPAWMHDAFISYSRRDRAFAVVLEKALKGYRPPSGVGAAQRYVDVFRDESDFTGTDYFTAIEAHLRQSRKLILLCSPAARASRFVDDEVRRFIQIHGAADVIPLLLSGVPNNEALPEDEAGKAFPQALCDAMQMPLATPYAGFDPRRDKISRGAFEGAWYALLANLYDVERSKIEQRDRNRQMRQRRIAAGAATVVILLLSGALVAAIIARNDAVEQRQVALTEKAEAQRQRDSALAGRLAAESRSEFDNHSDLSLLLAAASTAIAAGFDGRSALFSALTTRPKLHAFLHAAGRISGNVVISPDGKWAVTGAPDGAVNFWDMSTHSVDGSPMKGHTKGVTTLAFSPDGKLLATGSDDRTVILWDVSSRTMIGEPIPAHDLGVKELTFSPDGALLATRGEGASAVIIWDVPTHRPWAYPEFRGLPQGRVAFSPDGRLLAAEVEVGIEFWDVKRKASSGRRARAQDGPTVSMAFSPDSAFLAIGGRPTVTVWDMKADKPLLEQPFEGHTDQVNALAFSPDGKLLASGSSDKKIILWDMEKLEARGEPLDGSNRPIWSMAFSPDGKLLATAGTDTEVILWKVDAEIAMSDRFPEQIGTVGALAFSPDDKRLATGEDNGTVTLWDVEHRAQLGEPFSAHTGYVSSLTFTPDGKRLVTSGADGKIVLWDMGLQSPRGAPLGSQTMSADRIAVSKDGTLLAAAGSRQNGFLWDLTKGVALGPLITKREDRGRFVAFSPDGKLLAAEDSSDIRLWDVATRKPWGESFGFSIEGVAALSPNGELLAMSGDGSHPLVFWDIARHLRVGQPSVAHTKPVESLAFSPDGRLLASGSGDATVILWDVESRRPLSQPLSGHGARVHRAVFSHDGKLLATAAVNGTAILWEMDQAAWSARACSVANRNLTCAEWKDLLGTLPYRKVCGFLADPSDISACPTGPRAR